MLMPKNTLIVARAGAWTLGRRETFCLIRHDNGMCHTGSPKYICSLWNKRFAGPGQRVASLG